MQPDSWRVNQLKVLSTATEPRYVRWCETAAYVLCGIAGFVGSLTYTGWLFRQPLLTSFVSGAAGTKPNTALGLMAAAIACWYGVRRAPARPPAWTVILAISAGLLGALTLVEHLGDITLIDRWFVPATLPAPLDHALRMSPVAAGQFILLGVALVMLLRRWPAWTWQALAHVVLLGTLVAITGYLYDAEALQSTPALADTALPTSIAFLVLSLAIIIAHPTEGVMALYTSASAGGALARRLVLPLLFLPVLINWVELSGERRGWYPERTAWMLDAGVTVLALSALNWWTASALHETDARRETIAGALEDSENRFRQLLDTAPDAIIVNDRRRVQLANRAALRLLGAQQTADIVGRPALSFVPPDDRGAVEPALCAVLDRGDTVEALETRVLRLDGGIVDVDVAASATDVQGRRLAQIVVRDITKRKLDQDALRQSEERLRLITDTIAEVVWMANVSMTEVVYVSPAYEQVWGKTCADLYARPRSLIDSIHHEDRDRLRHDLRELATGARVDGEYRLSRANGDVRWIAVRASLIASHATSSSMYAAAAADVTDRRQLEVQLQQSQKMEALGQLAGGIAHDFNNLLTVIRGYAAFLEDDAAMPAVHRVHAHELGTAAERGATMTRQLLQFSRRQTLQPGSVEINHLVAGLAQMLERILGERVHLEVNVHALPLTVQGDSGMLEQVLMNLAVNARDAMPAGGLLTIETGEVMIDSRQQNPVDERPSGHYVVLRVRDTGEGIPPEAMPRIFEPFFSTKAAGKGTGLGLSTVFGIVKQHRGWIRVDSVKGEGTTFVVGLPASDPLAALVPSRNEAVIELAALPGQTVLVVEDDPAIRKLMQLTLQRGGYEVLVAGDSVDAFRLWDARDGVGIDLVVTDMVMPRGVGGRDLAASLRVKRPDLPVIFTSGYSVDSPRADEADGTRFLPKPFAPNRLLAVVREALRDPRRSA